MIKTNYQPHGVFFSGEPTYNDLWHAYNVLGVRYILSLDRNVARRVQQHIRKLGLPIRPGKEHITFHIDPGAPAGQASNLFNNALSYFGRKPMLVHCLQGKDRTGFAIASWLIKSGRQTPCGAIDEVTKTVEYGTGGIRPGPKMSMDRVLGCSQDQRADQNTVEDIASEMRDEFAHQQGAQSAGTVDGGYWADNIGFGNNWSDPDASYPGGTVGTNIREARKRLWKRIIRVAKDKIPGGLSDDKVPEFKDGQLQKGIKVEMEHTDDKEIAREIALDHLVEDSEYYDKLAEMEGDKNDSFLGGGPQGSPTADALPSGVGAPAIPGVGMHDNYTGQSSYMNQSSGAPGAPNAAGPVMPAQPNLMG